MFLKVTCAFMALKRIGGEACKSHDTNCNLLSPAQLGEAVVLLQEDKHFWFIPLQNSVLTTTAF